MLESGYRLPWVGSRPPLLPSPPPSQRSSREQEDAIDKEVLSMLQKKAIEELPPAPGPGFYVRLFVVPKASGGWRPILDLSALNKFLVPVHFKMETPLLIREAIRPGDWATSVDLKDAYFHILIHKAHRKYLRFVWKDRTFQLESFPSASLWPLTSSPRW